MAKRSEIVNLGGHWLKSHGLSMACETLGLFSRVRRAAPSLRTQPEKPLVASHGPTKTATLAMLTAPPYCGVVSGGTPGRVPLALLGTGSS